MRGLVMSLALATGVVVTSARADPSSLGGYLDALAGNYEWPLGDCVGATLTIESGWPARPSDSGVLACGPIFHFEITFQNDNYHFVEFRPGEGGALIPFGVIDFRTGSHGGVRFVNDRVVEMNGRWHEDKDGDSGDISLIAK